MTSRWAFLGAGGCSALARGRERRPLRLVRASGPGEGLLGDAEDRRLYWVDIKGSAVHRFDPATGRDTEWRMPEIVGCVARRASGGLVVALRSGFHFLDLDTGAIHAVATPEEDAGRRTASTTASPIGAAGSGPAVLHHPEQRRSTGALYRPRADHGTCHRMVDGCPCHRTPSAWSPDGRTS